LPRDGASEAIRRSAVAKVSHTLSTDLARRLEEFAFFQRVSESAVIEHSLQRFFAQATNDDELGEMLRREGAGRRRKA
jgi:predicted transcriptional regulator